MPPKTHKTAHVLNLLSVGTEKEETTEQAEAAEQTEKKETVSDIQLFDNPINPSDPLAGLIKDSLEKEIFGAIEPEEDEEVESEDTDIPSEPNQQTASEPQPTAQSASQPTAQPAIQPPALPEPDYSYVNIMDVLIDRRLEEFMKKFDTCTCDRCKKDVRALAMSNLPPKYIVMPNTSFAPLISFYANKYQFNIVTELTKACLAIISNPRHDGS